MSDGFVARASRLKPFSALFFFSNLSASILSCQVDLSKLRKGIGHLYVVIECFKHEITFFLSPDFDEIDNTCGF